MQLLGRNLHKIFHMDLVECMLEYPQESHLDNHIAVHLARQYGLHLLVGVVNLWEVSTYGRHPLMGIV